LELKPGRKFYKILLKNNPNKELQADWVCIAQDDIFMGHAITFYGVLSLRSSGAVRYAGARGRQEIQTSGRVTGIAMIRLCLQMTQH
jgi:hypothetical protein